MNQKGITLIQLVITIIVIVIITSFAVFQGSNVTTEATIAKEYESIKEIKKAVEQALQMIEINPKEYKESEIFGVPLSNNDKKNYYDRIGLTSANELSDRTYIITKDNQEKFQLEKINEEQVYIVDLDKEKYYILDGVQRDNRDIVYEYTDILKTYNMLSGKK